MAYDRSKHDAPGKPIGSPNDPLVGIAKDQTTGPGGNGLKKPPQELRDEKKQDHSENAKG